jgi:hypothetical protein
LRQRKVILNKDELFFNLNKFKLRSKIFNNYNAEVLTEANTPYKKILKQAKV